VDLLWYWLTGHPRYRAIKCVVVVVVVVAYFVLTAFSSLLVHFFFVLLCFIFFSTNHNDSLGIVPPKLTILCQGNIKPYLSHFII